MAIVGRAGVVLPALPFLAIIHRSSGRGYSEVWIDTLDNFPRPSAQKSLPQSYLKHPEASPPDLTVCLEAFYHHLPLGLIIPEVPKHLFLIRVTLAYLLQASLRSL